jgi:hypothetical protein
VSRRTCGCGRFVCTHAFRIADKNIHNLIFKFKNFPPKYTWVNALVEGQLWSIDLLKETTQYDPEGLRPGT